MAGQDLLELKQLRQVHPGGVLRSFSDGHQIIEGVQEWPEVVDDDPHLEDPSPLSTR